MVAIAGLVKEVARLALHVKRIVAISDAAEAERGEAVIRVVAARPTETVEQAEFKATSAATACDAQATDMAEAANFPLSQQQDSWTRNARISDDAQAIDMAEAANFPFSPQQDSWTRNSRISEKDAVDELNAGSRGLAKVEAALAEPKDANCRAENGIASRILELHDRLGGFKEPNHCLLHSQPPDQNT